MTRILGLETSCDETSAAVLSGRSDDVTLESLVILSQDVHRVFGGVVPELASRAHLTSIVPVVRRALADAGCALGDVNAVGVTYAPGLVGALLVGVSYAKSLAYALGVPVVGVHHLEGHVFAQSLEHADAVPPFTLLLVSGGHTLLADVPAWGEYVVLGRTRDDAAGEAFDKIAKLLGLPYPGGPHLERLARGGDPDRFRFARPMLRGGQGPDDSDYYDMSFSGLKTAVRLTIEELGTRIERERANVARAFQDALIDTLVAKTVRAATQFKRRRIVLGGGVACNRALAAAMESRAAQMGGCVYAPSPRLATDNAAMIARAALFRYECGEVARLDLDACAAAPLPSRQAA